VAAVLEQTAQAKEHEADAELETVSRLFSQFQKEGLIEVAQKHVRILDAARLARIAAAAR
jgi:CRP/FNR family transcriptional regulator